MENTCKKFLRQLFISATAVSVLIDACKKSNTTDPTQNDGDGTISPQLYL